MPNWPADDTTVHARAFAWTPYWVLAFVALWPLPGIAEGVLDLYPRFGPTSEWDTAAGQAILEAAGGAVDEGRETLGHRHIAFLTEEGLDIG